VDDYTAVEYARTTIQDRAAEKSAQQVEMALGEALVGERQAGRQATEGDEGGVPARGSPGTGGGRPTASGGTSGLRHGVRSGSGVHAWDAPRRSASTWFCRVVRSAGSCGRPGDVAEGES
jgi:hypothetical protein